MFKHLLSLLAVFALAGPAGADVGAGGEFAAAVAVFQRALAGERAATDEAVRRFEALAGGAADSPLFAAYLGAAQTLQGRDAWLPWSRLRVTEKGLATVDRAWRRLQPGHEWERVGEAPMGLETRLVVAGTFIGVPAFFNRFDTGKSVLREAFASPAFAAAPAELKARLHQQAALAAGREGRQPLEIEELKKALAADPAGSVSAAVRRRLAELGS